MDRLTERTGEGIAIPRMELRHNGYKRCMNLLAQYEDIGTVEDFKNALKNVRTLSNMYEKLRDQEVAEFHKLAEYEDFEEIFCSKMTDVSCDFLKDKEEFAKWLDRNKWIAKKCDEYVRAEEQGKLLKLPCAVGDTVYAFNMAKIIELKVIEISWFSIDRKSIVNVKCLNTNLDCFRNFIKEEFGKTVFLTKEEAEAALKGL